MQVVPIQALPNQQFSIVLDENRWEITLKTTNDVTSVSLSLNGAPVLKNARAVANVRIIPAIYQEAGNFVFSTLNEELPIYTQFSVSQFLLYFSAAELAAIRAARSYPLDETFFDPFGNLPLRFAPQGYVQA